jgi:hypothetical protein
MSASSTKCCACSSKKDIDRAQLAKLSNGLAPVDNAPAKVVGILVRHADSAIHSPALEQAKVLPDNAIAAIIDIK